MVSWLFLLGMRNTLINIETVVSVSLDHVKNKGGRFRWQTAPDFMISISCCIYW